MGTVAKTLDRYLQIFRHDDPLYKYLVSDVDGVPAATPIKPTDFNIGVIADMLEWNRRLTLSLGRQLYLDQATGFMLDYYVQTATGIYRFEGESDSEYSIRIKNYILSRRCSPASIIHYTQLYSPGGMPKLLEGQMDSAFADVSF